MKTLQFFRRKILAVIFLICMLAGTVTHAHATGFGLRYDGQAAADYAASHWNDGIGVCDQFVKDCLQAGGVEILAGGVDPLKNALTDAKLGTARKLVISADGVHASASENPHVQTGDILFFYCQKCSKSIHTAIFGGVGSNGYLYTYGHNPGWDKVDWFGSFTHTSADGKRHEACFDYTVVTLDRTAFSHTHSFTSGQYENAHPHHMYASCSCGAKYYLGWNATVSSCTTCNPSVHDVPLVTAAVEDNTIVVRWSTVKNALEYQVWRAKSPDGPYFNIYTAMGTRMTNRSVEEGVNYYYRVDAVLEKDSTGNCVKSAQSQVVRCSLTTLSSAEPAVVTTGHNAQGKPTLKWTAVNGADHYEVYRSTAENGTYTKVFTTTGITYTHTSATVGKPYFYFVMAVTADGSALKSQIVTNSYIAPDEPFTITTGHNTEGKPTLKWTLVNDADHYEVYRSTTKNGTYAKVFTTTGMTYTHVSATADKTYYYFVKAVKSNGSEQKSETIANNCAVPDEPFTVTTSHNSEGKPTLKWTAVNGVDHYEVYRSTAKNGTYAKVFTTTGKTYTHASAAAGKTYYYKVKVVSVSGTEEFSDIVTNSCKIPDVKFSIETGHNTAGKPTLKWAAIPGADHYEVYRSTSQNGTYIKVFTTSGKTYTHASATIGKIYYYKLQAYMVDGTNETSSVLINTCLDSAN